MDLNVKHLKDGRDRRVSLRKENVKHLQWARDTLVGERRQVAEALVDELHTVGKRVRPLPVAEHFNLVQHTIDMIDRALADEERELAHAIDRAEGLQPK